MSRLAKAKIPDDWDGESWRFAILCVPDSLGWRALVRGAIYQLTRGRNYDENTGIIKDAQAIGWEILETLDMTCGETLERIAVALEKHNAILAGETYTEAAEPEPVEHDYTETGLIPTINQAFFIDRTVYEDLNIAQVLMKGLVGRTIGFPWPFVGAGIADIADERIAELDSRFRQSDINLSGTPFEKNITETVEALFRDMGQNIFDPEWRPNIANIMQRSLNVADDSPLAEGIAKMINEWAWKLGIPGGIHDDEPRSVAELMMVIAQYLKDNGIATSNLDLNTVINIMNAQACGGCGQVNGNCTCQTGPSITVEDDNPPQVEGGTEDNLLECGCSEGG